MPVRFDEVVGKAIDLYEDGQGFVDAEVIVLAMKLCDERPGWAHALLMRVPDRAAKSGKPILLGSEPELLFVADRLGFDPLRTVLSQGDER